MRLVLVRTLWGLADRPEDAVGALAQVRAAGYDAVSCPVQTLPDRRAFAAELAENGLAYVPQVFTFGRTVDAHLDALRNALAASVAFAPGHVVAQTGRDGWSFDDAVTFLQAAQRIAVEVGVAVAHETHRGRILCNPWVTERVLAAVPDLRLSCDLSHWVCVGESLRLPERIVDLVAEAAIHIDARVGFEQGPQVPDPRVASHAAHLAAHEAWWDRIWRRREAAGDEALAVMPEFGPPPYQPVDPRTGEPLADVGEVNEWMAARLRARYGAP
ncbi:MAG TPA: hypothetical protein VHK88_02430 [Aquihabitans sp.]|jgi:hypothetical protein|nr:hypothetical protein [Aquihabitans sp.]